jgi:CheY-like chemotaxis protein
MTTEEQEPTYPSRSPAESSERTLRTLRHTVSNYVTASRMNAELLLREFGVTSEAQKKIHRIIKNLDMLQETLDELSGGNAQQILRPEASNKSSQTQPHIKKKVLIVDDASDLRGLISAALKGKGYDVIQAANGQQALAILESIEPPDLILLDLKMDEMDGPEMLDQLSAKNSRVLTQSKIAYLTGQNTPIHDKRVHRVLLKPIQLSVLMELVNNLIGT